MEDTGYRAIAIVGVGAVLPDAPNVATFWENVKSGRYSISDVTPDRWDPALYYDPDPAAPDKTYSKIGGWVREFEWDPMKWQLPIPPRVADAMDDGAEVGHRLHARGAGRLRLSQAAARTGPHGGDPGQCHGRGEALSDRACASSFRNMPANWRKAPVSPRCQRSVRHDITRQLHERMGNRLPEITEDTMPGELANCIAGPDCQRLQLPRAELRDGCRLCIGHGGDQRGGGRAGREPL